MPASTQRPGCPRGTPCFGNTTESGYLTLTYEFTNVDRCIEEIKIVQKSHKAAKPGAIERGTTRGKDRQADDDGESVEAECRRIGEE